jgi:hypothetical protein
MKIRSAVFGVMVAALAAAPAVMASDPVGCYGLIEKVVFAPNEGAPQTVQVWGAFVTARVPENRQSYRAYEAYGSAEKGYLYYTCPSGQAAACLSEWNDLKSLAGKGTVAGFGSRWLPAQPRVRKADEKPANPDEYKINVGVVPVGKYASYPELVEALKAAIKR